MATLTTRLTRMLDLRHPVVSAPMAFAGGGALAAAVSRAGGLGLIGGGYGDPAWLEAQFEAAAGARVGVGFITWSLRKSPSLLTDVLRHRPAAVMLSFGDPRPFVDEIRAAGARVICQCQDLGHVMDAVEVQADIVVAQGAEAGGHGAARGTLGFVPEAADYLAAHAPNTLLLAAGGIGDGRGLAASLALGADGVLLGTRLWASTEALVQPGHHQAILETDGDGTLRTTVADIARQIAWPRGFTARIRRNAFTDRWHGHEADLERAVAVEGPRYRQAFAAGDAEHTGVWFGEAAGVIHAIEPAAVIVERMVGEAAQCLARQAGAVGGPATGERAVRPSAPSDLASASALAFPEAGQTERLAPPPVLDADQQAAADELINGPRGGVYGPFRPLLHRPPLLRAAAKLGETLRYTGTLDAALREWTICVVARETENVFEWEMHHPLAVRAGVPVAALEALATRSALPAGLDPALALAARLARELLAAHRIGEATYAQALVQWGEAALVELLTLAGYFAMVCWVMNVARTPGPQRV